MNATAIPVKQTSLAQLKQALAWAKSQENTWKQERLNIENEILAHPEVAPLLTDEGTARVEGIKIVTSFTRKWDSAALGALAPEIEPIYFPFDVEFKENRRKSREIEAAHPDLWARLREALTVKPAKPAVSLEDEA